MPVRIAFGIVFLGSITSSVGKVESSNPAYAQKIRTSARPNAETSPVKNGIRFPANRPG